MKKYICIHGHFYQPPRENPWLEEVESQDSAAPYHDWNHRITAECYEPNTASRILDSEGRIVDIVNNYSKMSFNFGPTILSWFERHKPNIYDAILKADTISRKLFSGHGSALAQAYNHIIMPLANKRDKYTQAIWGIKDFEKRFGRHPEGMWLPETAVDMATLEVLADVGINFTILKPTQASKVRGENGEWFDVSNTRIDPTAPYICHLPSGKQITLFFYDNSISGDVAFGDLLDSGDRLANRMYGAFNDNKDHPQLVHFATDGESYGHHHRHGDMALAYCLSMIEREGKARITNYGEYLEKFPPSVEVEFYENSSWSCSHGIERWKSDCGCCSGSKPEWNQKWRKPLRSGMDWLRDNVAVVYEKNISKYQKSKNPWEIRNCYIDVIFERSNSTIKNFFKKHFIKEPSKEDKIQILKLLEMQRNSMLMYTSCGWFFDDISGIEATQVMQYALKTMQYYEDLTGKSLEPEYIKIVTEIQGNCTFNGLSPYEIFVKPMKTDLLRIGAEYGITSVFREDNSKVQIFCYTVDCEKYEKRESGRLKVVTGKALITSDITLEGVTIFFALLHLGDHNISIGVGQFTSDETFSMLQQEIEKAFDREDTPHIIRLLDIYFGNNTYSIWHLTKDEGRRIVNQILQLRYDGIEASYRHIYESNCTLMNFFHGIKIPIPKAIYVAAEYILNSELKKIFEDDDLDIEKLDNTITNIKKWSISIDEKNIVFIIGSKLDGLMKKLLAAPDNINLIEKIVKSHKHIQSFPMEYEFRKSQNIFFSIKNIMYIEMKEKSDNKNPKALRWIEAFHKLADCLGMKI